MEDRNVESASYLARLRQELRREPLLMGVLGTVTLVPLLAAWPMPGMQRLSEGALRLMVGLTGGLWLMRGQRPGPAAGPATGTGPYLAVMLFGLDTGLALAMTPANARGIGLVDFLRVAMGILLFCAIGRRLRRQALCLVWGAMVATAALIAGLGLVIWATRHMLIPRLGTLAWLPPLFGDHQLFGAYLLLHLPLSLAAVIETQGSRLAVLAGLAAGLTGLGLLATGTRTAWAGALVSLLVLTWLRRIERAQGRHLPRRRTSRALCWLLLLACGALFLTLGGVGYLQARLQPRFMAASLTDRWRIWTAAGELACRKPIWGHGLGSYPLLQRPYTRVGLPAEVVQASAPTLSEMAHSFWLQMLVEQGAVGMILFAVVLMCVSRVGLCRIRADHHKRIPPWCSACLAATAGFAVDALGNPAWQFARVYVFLWILLGLVIGPSDRDPADRGMRAGVGESGGHPKRHA